jgi:hypothetical protein
MRGLLGSEHFFHASVVFPAFPSFPDCLYLGTAARHQKIDQDVKNQRGQGKSSMLIGIKTMSCVLESSIHRRVAKSSMAHSTWGTVTRSTQRRRSLHIKASQRMLARDSSEARSNDCLDLQLR